MIGGIPILVSDGLSLTVNRGLSCLMTFSPPMLEIKFMNSREVVEKIPIDGDSFSSIVAGNAHSSVFSMLANGTTAMREGAVLVEDGPMEWRSLTGFEL